MFIATINKIKPLQYVVCGKEIWCGTFIGISQIIKKIFFVMIRKKDMVWSIH